MRKQKERNTMHFKYRISNLTLIGYSNFYAFVPDEYSQEIKDELVSVFAKRVLDLKSIDYTYKKFINTIPNEIKAGNNTDPEKILLKEINCTALTFIEEVFDRLNSIKIDEHSVSSIAVVTTLNRLVNSYESAFFLINNHLYFESVAILRIIFEQLAFCMSICDMTDEEYDALSKSIRKQKLSPTNIQKIKQIFNGDTEIGPLYSYLSEINHIDFKKIPTFLSFDKQDESVNMTLRSIHQSIEVAINLLGIIDIHSVILEYSLRKHIKGKYKYIENNGDKFHIRRGRPIRIILSEYHQKHMKLMKT
jgi:hypothetical protein